MKQIQSNYIILEHGDTCYIRLIKDKEYIRHRPISEDVFENVTIIFNDNGSITIEGDCWQYGIEFTDVYPSELSYNVHPSYIDKTRFRKKDIVRAGWHRKLENIHKSIIVNKYAIIEDK